MQSLANSGVFWVLLIAGIVVVYGLPTIIGLIRGVDGLGLVVLLNLIGWVAWPAALILAFGPRRLPPPLPAYPLPVQVYSPVVIVYPQQWPSAGRPMTAAPHTVCPRKPPNVCPTAPRLEQCGVLAQLDLPIFGRASVSMCRHPGPRRLQDRCLPAALADGAAPWLGSAAVCGAIPCCAG